MSMPSSIQSRHGPQTGRNFGREIVSFTSSKVTSTGMPILIAPGSGSTSTKLVGMRAPSSVRTNATTYGATAAKAGEGARWTTENAYNEPLPEDWIQPVLREKHCGQMGLG